MLFLTKLSFADLGITAVTELLAQISLCFFIRKKWRPNTPEYIHESFLEIWSKVCFSCNIRSSSELSFSHGCQRSDINGTGFFLVYVRQVKCAISRMNYRKNGVFYFVYWRNNRNISVPQPCFHDLNRDSVTIISTNRLQRILLSLFEFWLL